eukprot:m.40227 g.40227  ORF g.40227 m.40227 type:complete len:355 (+) comp12736_c0_seq2:1284-2348(+)
MPFTVVLKARNKMLLLLLATSVALASLAHGSASPPPPPPSPAYEKLEQEYSELLNTTCNQVKPHVPTLPTTDVNNFMQAYQAFNGSGSETTVLYYARVLLNRSDVQSFIQHPDSFGAGGLDAAMVKCAVLVEATPSGLAAFAVQNASQEALVASLLNNTMLMRDMLVAGGANGGNYGQAMLIYSNIINSSHVLQGRPVEVSTDALWDSRNQSTVLHRMALGVAVEQAVPIQHRWRTDYVDPVVRYLRYEHAYLAGELDPFFEILTAFECRHLTDADATEDDVVWMRTTMENYRPDHVVKDNPWRYAYAVHTEVSLALCFTVLVAATKLSVSLYELLNYSSAVFKQTSWETLRRE